MKIYLAGRISGLSYENAIEWRNYVTNKLKHSGDYKIINPMRQKSYLKEDDSIKNDYPNTIISGNKAVFQRDTFDVRRADVILVNFDTMDDGKSIGTMFEIGLAYGLNKLIIIVDSKNRFNHPFIKEPSIKIKSLDDAIRFIKGLDLE